MNRPARTRAPRAIALARRRPRSRPEAAAELVRLEYERDRLARDLAVIDGRRARTDAALKLVEQRLERLKEFWS